MSDKKGATSGAVIIAGMKFETDERNKVKTEGKPEGKVEIKGIQPGEPTIPIPLVPNKEREEVRD